MKGEYFPLSPCLPVSSSTLTHHFLVDRLLGAHPLKQGSPLANAAGVIAEIAQNKGVKPNQIALAWLLHYAPNIILIPGTTSIAHLEENMATSSIQLTEAEIEQLNTVQ